MLDAIRWDPELIRRYDQAGPRYPSYPTVAQFHSGVGSFDLLHALRNSRRERRALSLYVHIPFCANACYYCARHKVVSKDRSCSQPYLKHLEREIAMVACHLGADQRVEQLQIGGGTPTYLNHAELRQLMQALRTNFNLLDDDSGDYGIEIDPREADWSTIGLLRELGFNRVSLGVQALDPDVQRAVNRLQSLEQTRTIVDAARTLQYRSINIDLIYGLPRQNTERFYSTVKAILEMQPERISLYNYMHRPERHSSQRRIQVQDLPSPEEKLEMLHNAIEQLTAAGYRYVGLDHFALPDDELAMAQEDGFLQRNFQGYTTHGHCDVIGLGVSAISQVGTLYCQNDTDLAGYQNRLDSDQLGTFRGLHCNSDDLLRRDVIQRLICHFELDFASLEQAHGIRMREYFADIWPHLQAMHEDGLLTLDDQGIQILPTGRLLVRTVCMLFDRYLEPVQASALKRACGH